MLSDNAKRNISFGVFGFGIFADLLACGASAPVIFTIGANDTLPEIIALLLAFDTPLLVCVIALWYRRFAGWWLLIVGLYFPCGLLLQREFSRAGPGSMPLLDYFAICLIVSGPLLALGLFGVLTERAGWPKLLRSGGAANRLILLKLRFLGASAGWGRADTAKGFAFRAKPL
jgi:hypothetical protein